MEGCPRSIPIPKYFSLYNDQKQFGLNPAHTVYLSLDRKLTRGVIIGDREGGGRVTITEVSDKYDLTQDTLRYYERIGLIPAVTRSKSGVRNY